VIHNEEEKPIWVSEYSITGRSPPSREKKNCCPKKRSRRPRAKLSKSRRTARKEKEGSPGHLCTTGGEPPFSPAGWPGKNQESRQEKEVLVKGAAFGRGKLLKKGPPPGGVPRPLIGGLTQEICRMGQGQCYTKRGLNMTSLQDTGGLVRVHRREEKKKGLRRSRRKREFHRVSIE